ncbi:hypothetical protein UFOVP136_13 [uncultured Caudovirales phage]|uniref:Uncharacterized protein n=1 Tax=uncultured Caudovirales phage TaxID=2100421 RepID=A0A6J5LEK5_9CAUD|nr:hypothetical protein UFOVP136_13 [uncultured Caudovirales phage]
MTIIDALKTGKMLGNPAFWKRCQIQLALVAGFLPLAVTAFPSLQTIIDHALVSKIDGSITAVIVYLTVATTDKLGV